MLIRPAVGLAAALIHRDDQRGARHQLTQDPPQRLVPRRLRDAHPHLPIIARAWDLEGSSRLLDAGATEAYPEAIEASLRLGAAALEMIGASPEHVDRLVQSVRDVDYEPVREGSPTE